ncbi:MAG: DUF5677 domain-containing protein [Hyphomicrobiales bacterium]
MKTSNLQDYRKYLRDFDVAVCEATAVSQAVGQRFEAPAIGYSTHVFGRVCAHAQALVCAAPKSRWVKREFYFWDVSAVAPHARSILEGYLLFRYLADAPNDLDTQRAYVQVMHLYDCMKRIKILPKLLSDDEIRAFEEQAIEIRERLENIEFFNELNPKLKKELLAGKWLMITPKMEVIKALDMDQKEFDFYWNYFSQYTHVLSFTFHRVEPNGRGSGVENSFDRAALCLVLQFSTELMVAAIERLVELFPDVADVRKGLDSKFAPGPARNLPKHLKRIMKTRP